MAALGAPGAGLWARRLALVLAGIGLGFGLGETALRLAQPFPKGALLPLSYYEGRLRRVAAGETYFRFDQDLGWVTTPNVVRRGAVTYRNNRAGMRADREYAADPPPGVRRLEAFGDSFTYCQDVELAQCWTTELERLWPGTEVLNFGVTGYGPDLAWLRYQRDGPALHPCAVLIGYMVENVNRVVNRFYPFYEPDTGIVASKPRFLLADQSLALLPNPVTDPNQLNDPLWVERTLGPHDDWYFPGVFVAGPLDRFEMVRLARTAAFRTRHEEMAANAVTRAYREQGEAFQIVGRVLVGFARQVRAAGATPVVILFGRAEEIDTSRRGEAPVYGPLLAWLAREDVPTIDVTEALAEEERRSGAASAAKFHYTPLGNQVVATVLARKLPETLRSTCPP